MPSKVLIFVYQDVRNGWNILGFSWYLQGWKTLDYLKLVRSYFDSMNCCNLVSYIFGGTLDNKIALDSKYWIFYVGIHSGVYPGHISRSSSDLRSHAARTHSRTPSMDLRHSRNSSADLNKFFKNEINVLNNVGPPGMLHCLLCWYA